MSYKNNNYETNGAGVRDMYNSAKKTISNSINTIQSNIINMIPESTKYTNKTMDILTKYGKFKIINLLAIKTPVNSNVMKLVNTLTLNEMADAMNKEGVDRFYHMSLKIQQLDDLGNIISFLIEKNEAISISIFKSIPPGSQILNIDITIAPPFNLNLFMTRTREAIGNNAFFVYNSLTANCGDFVLALLKSNFVYNNSYQLFLYQTNNQNKIVDMSKFKKHISKNSQQRLTLTTKLGAYIKGRFMGGNLNINDDYNIIRFI